MTDDEARVFLLEGTRTGKLATVREDGSPHIAPIWFTLDDEDLVFATGAETVKARNMRRDPRVTLCADLEEPPYGYVRVDGRAQLIDDDPDALLHWCTVIGGRYMGADRAEEFGRRNAVPSERLVRVTIERLVAPMEVAD
ncbi:MAG: PPOX class F420-dependent oxidoreductase [Egibacteraceae bacterium]